MLRFSGLSFALFIFLLTSVRMAHATETMHPIKFPTTQVAIAGTVELNDDVYSSDLTFSAEYAPISRFSVYADGSFRFLSYSYEYSTKGYIHNYCNLHVNGFNETYVGVKALIWRGLGLDLNWRFPPGEGSQLNRFHRLKVEPFNVWSISSTFTLGTSIRYSTFLEAENFKPGDELGLRATLDWKFDHWEFTQMYLYQARITESENRNLKGKYKQMKDKYRGIKFDYEIMRHFDFFKVPFGIGINYQIHKGTQFGFETGHQIGLKLQVF